ncbi:MAG TPA: sigma-54 dependent transcriptional regulator, partial [Enhygromyxa sp.]|nr:sigma-54 dependent transcriptional regulator [Enhygromyxa sp.]
VTLWRSAALSKSVTEFLERVGPVVFEQLHATGVVVRGLDSKPPTIETLAAVHVGLVGARSLRSPRHALSEGEVRRIRDELSSGVRFRGNARHGRAWIRAVLAGLEGSSTQSWMVLPLQSGGETLGVAAIAGEVDERDEHWAILQEACAAALAHHLARRGLERVREAAEADRAAALGRLQVRDVGPSVIGEDAGLREVMQQVETVAPTDAPVLILGETGSGKEVVARSIHERSARRSGPVLRVNCGAIPPELVDSELFGHERGAFTGAQGQRIGWFERADGGTLFLDEVGELPLAAQVRLLRVLQDGSYERVGGQRPLSADVRVVAATHRDLPSMVKAGRFREDLWYRIAVFTIRLPPLRERKQDIPALVRYFATTVGHRYGSGPLQASDADLRMLDAYDWPGNVRELGAVIERAAVLGQGRRLEVARALGSSIPASASTVAVARHDAVRTLDDVAREAIEHALRVHDGRIDGPRGAARALGIHANTLRSRMLKLGLKTRSSTS